MSNLTLTKPVKYEDAERWIVYIVGKDGLLTGEAGMGNSPKEATENAQAHFDAMTEK